MSKKVLSLLMTVTMVLSLCSIDTFAVGTVVYTISTDKVSASAGEYVITTVGIRNETSSQITIGCCQFDLVYDKDAFKLAKTDETPFDSEVYTVAGTTIDKEKLDWSATFGNQTEGEIIVAISSGTAVTYDIPANGEMTLLKIAFQALKNVESTTAAVQFDASGENRIFAENADDEIPSAVTATVTSGVTVSGTVTSFNSDTDDVTIQLIQSGTSEAAYEAVVKGNSASYSIASVPAGTYTMKVMKKNHVTREYTVTVSDSNVTQDAKICPLGDVTGDGKVNTLDYGKVLRHAKKNTLLTGYEFLCGDVDENGRLNTADYGKILRHTKKLTLLW